MLIYNVDDGDARRAWDEARARYRDSRERGLRHDRSVVRTPHEHRHQEYLGCLGEIATAMHLGIPWEPRVGVFHTIPDVGTVDVRTVDGCGRRLIIRDDDPPERIFVLVTRVDGRRMWIRGWLPAGAARRAEWIDDPGDRRPSWFVPAGALRPMRELPRSA